MDYSKRNKVKVYHSKYYNHYSEDDNYPRRIRKPVAILLVLVVVALFAISLKLFK